MHATTGSHGGLIYSHISSTDPFLHPYPALRLAFFCDYNSHTVLLTKDAGAGFGSGVRGRRACRQPPRLTLVNAENVGKRGSEHVDLHDVSLYAESAPSGREVTLCEFLLHFYYTGARTALPYSSLRLQVSRSAVVQVQCAVEPKKVLMMGGSP